VLNGLGSIMLARARGGSDEAVLCWNAMGPEWIVVLIVVLVLFGGSQLPKLAKGLGSAQREFKKGLEDGAADEK
jgi:sec-independent protein translocase protein TatA